MLFPANHLASTESAYTMVQTYWDLTSKVNVLLQFQVMHTKCNHHSGERIETGRLSDVLRAPASPHRLSTTAAATIAGPADSFKPVLLDWIQHCVHYPLSIHSAMYVRWFNISSLCHVHTSSLIDWNCFWSSRANSRFATTVSYLSTAS